MEWFKNFVKFNDLYIYEFRSRKEEGNRVTAGILNYMDINHNKIARVLDIPCGIGRISRGFLDRGMHVTGIDISEPYLSEFGKSVAESRNSKNLTLVNADFKNFQTYLDNREFDLIINWWTSFGYTTQQDDVEFFGKLLTVSHRDTMLMVETWHRKYITNHKINVSYKDLGKIVVVNENTFLDNDSTVITTHRYYKKSGKNLIFLNQFDSAIKLYTEKELLAMMNDSGWEVMDVFNDIETMEKFNSTRDRIVIIAKPRKGPYQL